MSYIPPVTFAQNARILEALASHAQTPNPSDLTNSKEKFRVIFNGHIYEVLAAKKNNALIRFLRYLLGKSKLRTSDNLCHLKKFFESISAEVNSDPALKDLYKPLVERAFEGLKQLFEVYRTDNTKEGILKRNDILEALSVAYRKDNSLNEQLGLSVQRIAATPPSAVSKTSLSESSIPLVRFSDMTQAIALIEAATPGISPPLSLKEVHEKLQGVLFDERVPMGRVIDAMYTHEMHAHTIDKFLTWGLGKTNRYKNVTALSIVKFLKSLNVTPYVEFNGQLYAYNEVYKTELRAEISNDTAFLRCIKDEIAQEFLLKNANLKQEEIYKTCGEGNVIISNSFNRLRLHYVGKNDGSAVPGTSKKGVNAKFNITGKVLSDSTQNRQAAKHEKSYNGKFAFSIKNMLGSEDRRDTTINRVVVASELKADAAHRKLLDCMTNMIDRHDMTMIVQRLAPEDVHHFTFPAKGMLLSKEESCSVLLTMLEKTAHENEKAQLKELINYFSAQSQDDKADATINIQGTQRSVNSKALHKHSEILAQNDRRITMMRHEDGSLSIHTFIGATGVNAVNVNGITGSENAGTNVGSMGFGNLSGKKLWQSGQAYDSQPSLFSRFMRRKTTINSVAGTEGTLGAPVGSFPKEGSTVVSLYFSKDMMPTEELHKFTKTVRYKISRNASWIAVRNCFCAIIGNHFGMKKTSSLKISRAIEVKANLGDVVGLPKIYVAVKAVTETIPAQEFADCIRLKSESPQTALKAIKSAFLNAFDPNKPLISLQDKLAHNIWEALQKDPLSLTEDDQYLLAQLDKGLLRRVDS